FNLLRTRRLALNRDRTGIPTIMQFRKHALEVDQALPNEHFFAQLARVSRPLAILRTHAADMRTQNVHCIDRIRLAIEDEVCSVETHSEVWQVHVMNYPRHCGRSLLAGFHQK